ncbi:MAG TPA: hypothetical protein VKB69_00550 [Micromonosporaceae bacterium]|nr:hypothetical protein [Micromonosporaceae bacterium]
MDLDSLLREEFTAGPAEPPTLVDERIAAARRTRRRRDLATRAALVAAVLAATAGVAGIVDIGTRHTVPAVPSPSAPLDRAAAMRLAEETQLGPGQPVDGQFIDAQHGWIALLRCTTPDPDQHCALTYAITDNAGATFRKLPISPSATAGEIYMFDSDHLVFDRWTEPRLVSDNGGRTWREVTDTSSGTVDTVPAGDLLAEVVDPATEDGIFGAMGPDGTLRRLTNAPVGAMPLSEPRDRPVGGIYFAAVGARLMASDDAGATWRSADVGTAVSASDLSVFGDAARLYATNETAVGDVPTLLTSTDRGATWTVLPWPATGAFPVPAQPPRTMDIFAGYDGRSATYLPGSGLYASDGLAWWRLEPATSQFTPVAMRPSVIWQPIGGALVSLGTDPRHPSAWISVDGTHWNPIHVP